MEKMDFRKLSSEQRYILRLRAINLIKSGEKQKEIAASLWSSHQHYKYLGEGREGERVKR